MFVFSRFAGVNRFKVLLLALIVFSGAISPVFAVEGEELYRELSRVARGQGDVNLFHKLNSESRKVDWEKPSESEFEGHLRLLDAEAEALPENDNEASLYLVRNITGELHILSVPFESDIQEAKETSPYYNLNDLLGKKLNFVLWEKEGVVDGETYSFVKLQERPTQLLFDRVFRISTSLLLFFVMTGMGLTLTLNDFKFVFQRPRAIFIGASLQWIVMPLIAVAMGYIMGFYQAFPFIFAGIVLITVSPGGVVSNLMTHYAKGDLALSISLTSFSTVLSLFLTPFLLILYCAHIEDVVIPVDLVVGTIILMVLIPLAIGMSVRYFRSELAIRGAPFFSLLGLMALLFIILGGALGNLEVFTDTERYGLRFYSTVFILSLIGMATGALIPKLGGVDNYQARAVSMETGLRNAILAMTIAVLIQDHMGDFYSSMLFTSAMFGLFMFPAGFITIGFFNKLVPLKTNKP